MASKIIELKVNGCAHEVVADALTPLAQVLREQLGYLGVKEGCGSGQCGCCSVIMDGRVVSSCLVLAVEAHQREIITAEGLAKLSPQAAATAGALTATGAATDAFAASGLAVAAAALEGDEAAVRRALDGTCLCRSGYDQAVAAVSAARKEASDGR